MQRGTDLPCGHQRIDVGLWGNCGKTDLITFFKLGWTIGRETGGVQKLSVELALGEFFNRVGFCHRLHGMGSSWCRAVTLLCAL